MPTGYTYAVVEGKLTNVNDFLLTCAKAFGAFVHLREESLNTKIKYREVSPYHAERLKDAEKEHAEFLTLSDTKIQQQIDLDYEKEVIRVAESLKKFQEEKQRTVSMLEKVTSWVPPTAEHYGLKKFAIKQLESTLNFDYSKNVENSFNVSPKQTVEDYKKTEMKSYLYKIEYHKKEYIKETESVGQANEWIKELLGSLEKQN